MKICCIDIGTNSVLCLLSQISQNKFTPLSFHQKTTRLGKSLGANKSLSTESQNATIYVIKKWLREIKADKYLLAGTSALRNARNSKQFLARVNKETGLQIRVLSGGEEAALSFLSVSNFIKPFPKKTVIYDIGGGSTEIIRAVNGRLVSKKSINIGAVNLTEEYGSNFSKMESRIAGALKRYLDGISDYRIICVGGTVTTLGAIIRRLKEYDPNKVHGMSIAFNKVNSVSDRLRSATSSERRNLVSFDKKRIDIITAGIAILKVIMELSGAKKFTICDRGLVYGMALSHFSSFSADSSVGK